MPGRVDATASGIPSNDAMHDGMVFAFVCVCVCVCVLCAANEQLETARKQLATATEKEREATMLLRQVQASADERVRCSYNHC